MNLGLNKNAPPAEPLVWWAWWLLNVFGAFVTYFFFKPSSGPPDGHKAGELSLCACLLPVIASTVVRWIVMPKQAALRRRFSLFVIGMVLAQGSTFLGVFSCPRHKTMLFFLSLAGIAQFSPFSARRWISEEESRVAR